MPYKVGDVVRYNHALPWETKQLSLWQREKLNGKIAIVLEVAQTENIIDYLCYIDGKKLWVNGVLLHELGEENENKKKNS